MHKPKQDPAALESAADRDPVERLAEEFLDRRRQGLDVSVSEYADRYPHLARRIRDLFPALLLLEDLKPQTSSSHASGGQPLSAAWSGKLERLGDFRILREIGRGGMGVVYEAEQESLGRRVALKVLPAVDVASRSRLRRFVREAQAVARLHHTNIVPIFGMGEQDGVRYHVMQLIHGQGLDKVLRALCRLAKGAMNEPHTDEGPAVEDDGGSSEAFSTDEAARMLQTGFSTGDSVAMSLPSGDAAPAVSAGAISPAGRYWRNVARLGVQVAEALQYAHRQGILHRDIKPANLLLDRRGSVWVADFGLAKLADLDDLTRSGDVVGTLRYMAPEVFAGKADARSDVYSLGLTLYELLTLQPAFDADDRGRLIRQVTQEEPPRPRKIDPAIPRDLETIVMKAVACHPGHRYQSAGELAADLRCFLEDRPVRARRATPLERAWRWCRRNRAVALLGGTALLLLVAVAAVASIGYLRTNEALGRVSIEREQAEAARQQADEERIRTRAQRERAERNLHLATRAFEDIFSKVASGPDLGPSDQDDEEQWPEAADALVTGKEAALLESLLKFYDQFAQQNQADVKLQKETARAYRRVGDIQRRLGQYERSETAYRRALAIYQAIADASPGNSDAFTTVAAVYNDMGVALRSAGKFLEARDAHLRSKEVLSRGGAADGSPEGRFELAQTYRYLSSMSPGNAAGRGWPRGARRGPRGGAEHGPGVSEYNRKALDILARLSQESPDNCRYRLALACCQRDRSAIATFGGRADEAQAARQEAIRILEGLVTRAPHNPDYRFELALTYALWRPRPRDGKPASEAKSGWTRAAQLAGELAAQCPTVPEYRMLLARSSSALADLARAAGATDEAEKQLGKSVEIGRQLSSEFSGAPAYRYFLLRSLHALAELQSSRNEWPKARAAWEEAIALAKKLQESDSQGRPARTMLAAEYSGLAKVLKALGEDALAKEASEKAAASGSHRSHPANGPRHRGHERPADAGRAS